MITLLHDVCDVEVLGHYRLRLTFSDGLVGNVDLSHLREREGVFTALRDPAFFAHVRVDPEIGTITWPNGADLAPEVLYERAAAHPSGIRARQLRVSKTCQILSGISAARNGPRTMPRRAVAGFA